MFSSTGSNHSAYPWNYYIEKGSNKSDWFCDMRYIWYYLPSLLIVIIHHNNFFLKMTCHCLLYILVVYTHSRNFKWLAAVLGLACNILIHFPSTAFSILNLSKLLTLKKFFDFKFKGRRRRRRRCLSPLSLRSILHVLRRLLPRRSEEVRRQQDVDKAQRPVTPMLKILRRAGKATFRPALFECVNSIEDLVAKAHSHGCIGKHKV